MSATHQKCVYNCANCNKIYKTTNGLIKHNKTCIPKEKEKEKEVISNDDYDSTPDTSPCLTPKKLNDAIHFNEFLENCDGPIDLDECVKSIFTQIKQQNIALGNTIDEIDNNVLYILVSLKTGIDRINALIEEKRLIRVARLMRYIKENNGDNKL